MTCSYEPLQAAAGRGRRRGGEGGERGGAVPHQGSTGTRDTGLLIK